MRADRLCAIVLQLQSRGRLTAPELDVSVRTIYRDMTALGTAGIPVHAGPDGYRTHLTGLTEAATMARLKLDAALPDGLRAAAARMQQRLHFDAPNWYDDGDSSDRLTGVADAVWQQHVIDIRYDSWKQKRDHRVEPHGLVLKTGRWYVVPAPATASGPTGSARSRR